MVADSSEVENDAVLKEIKDAGDYDLLGDIDWVSFLSATSNYYLMNSFSSFLST